LVAGQLAPSSIKDQRGTLARFSEFVGEMDLAKITARAAEKRGSAIVDLSGTTTPERTPVIGFKLMEIHGSMLWSADAIESFDASAMRESCPSHPGPKKQERATGGK